MVKITCLKCHWSWSLNADAVQAAYDSLKPGEKHFSVPCPRCGRINKISARQLKQALPRQATDKTESSEQQTSS